MNSNDDVRDSFPTFEEIPEKYRLRTPVYQKQILLRSEIRENIVSAALSIAKISGWPSLSMRKLAAFIGCSVPLLYGYFENKEAILMELTRLGFSRLEQSIKNAEKQFADPAKRLKNMWMAYWEFAFADKESYQLMFGIGIHCCDQMSGHLFQHFVSTIKSVLKINMESEVDDNFVLIRFYGYWAAIHGLVAINFLNKENCPRLNQNVLHYALNEVVVSN